MQRRSRLPSTVVALGVVSLLTDLSSEMIYPLLPAFLATALGAGAVAIGTIEGVAETTAAMVKVVSGRLTDRSGKRKPLVVAGYTTSGLARPLIALATVWPMVAALRFTDRVGKGLRTSPRDALIADSVDQGARGRAFGLHRSMDHAGAVLGPLVAAGLISVLNFELRAVIWAAAIPAVLVLLVLIFFVREPKTPPVAPAKLETVSGPLPRPFKHLVWATVLFTLGNSTDAFFLLRFNDNGVPVAGVAVLWAAHSAVKMISTWTGGRLTDRFGRRPLVLSGWILYAGLYAAFGLIESAGWLIVVFLAYGITFGLTEPAERAWVADLAPPERRGTAYGWYHGAIGMAALPASVTFGIVYETFGATAAFGMGAVLALAAAMVLSQLKTV